MVSSNNPSRGTPSYQTQNFPTVPSAPLNNDMSRQPQHIHGRHHTFEGSLQVSSALNALIYIREAIQRPQQVSSVPIHRPASVLSAGAIPRDSLTPIPTSSGFSPLSSTVMASSMRPINPHTLVSPPATGSHNASASSVPVQVHYPHPQGMVPRQESRESVDLTIDPPSLTVSIPVPGNPRPPLTSPMSNSLKRSSSAIEGPAPSGVNTKMSRIAESAPPARYELAASYPSQDSPGTEVVTMDVSLMSLRSPAISSPPRVATDSELGIKHADLHSDEKSADSQPDTKSIDPHLDTKPTDSQPDMKSIDSHLDTKRIDPRLDTKPIDPQLDTNLMVSSPDIKPAALENGNLRSHEECVRMIFETDAEVENGIFCGPCLFVFNQKSLTRCSCSRPCIGYGSNRACFLTHQTYSPLPTLAFF